MIPHLNAIGNVDSVSVMGSEAVDYGWEDVYRLYGVCVDLLDDTQPSQGESGSSPTPLTNFSQANRWF